MYDDIIVEEECCSEKRNTAQELQPALKRIKKAQSSTPTGMAPGAPVVVADHCIGHVPHSVSVERQIPIRDSVCDNPPKDFDCKESPRSSISSYAEIENHNSSVKNNGSTNETTINNHILKVQVPEESHYLKLQPYPVASDVYTELNQQTLTDDLGTTGPQTVYYINQSVIWNHTNMAWNTQWMMSLNCVIAAGTVCLRYMWVTASDQPTKLTWIYNDEYCTSLTSDAA